MGPSTNVSLDDSPVELVVDWITGLRRRPAESVERDGSNGTMSTAAQQDETGETYLATGTDGSSALQQLAAERLAAHRSRRAGVEGVAAQARRDQAAVRLQARRESSPAAPIADAARVREAVAARYLQSPTYREFLAAEAKRALEQAQAEAEVAARSARAVVAAQQQLLDEIAQWNQPELDVDGPRLLTIVKPKAEPRKPSRAELKAEARQHEPEVIREPVQLQVRMHEELKPAPQTPAYVRQEAAVSEPDELAQLEEEIEFRRAPEFVDLDLVTQAIPANIIEFPRELVAPRKVRPRLAEGPLLEEIVPEPQLRIFEVEAEQVAAEPDVVEVPDAAEWQSLRLGSASASPMLEQSFAHLEAAVGVAHPIYVASAARRMVSAAVDGLLLMTGVALAGAVAVHVAGSPFSHAPLPMLAGTAAGTLAVFTVIYRLLFFTLNEATPGMRATRISFCTFDERSPKRKFMRRRLIATLVAAAPLGMGLLWTLLDSDRLGWHDRISRMYPRKY
jgi:hypothetical protein